jgi:hypothetical protein
MAYDGVLILLERMNKLMTTIGHIMKVYLVSEFPSKTNWASICWYYLSYSPATCNMLFDRVWCFGGRATGSPVSWPCSAASRSEPDSFSSQLRIRILIKELCQRRTVAHLTGRVHGPNLKLEEAHPHKAQPHRINFLPHRSQKKKTLSS